MTVPIWKIWDPEQPEILEIKIDRQRTTAARPTKYNNIKITNKMKVIRK